MKPVQNFSCRPLYIFSLPHHLESVKVSILPLWIIRINGDSKTKEEVFILLTERHIHISSVEEE